MATERRLVVRALVLAVLVEHVLLVVAPLDVLAPLDPWRIGRHLLHGQLPYRDFSFEYPPLAAVAFLLPGLGPHGAAKSVLALQEVAAEAVMVWFVLRGRQGAVLRWAVLSLLVFPFLSGGFDALPMAAIALSTAWLARGEVRGWVAAGVGALVKLSPAAAWVWSRARWRAGAAVLAVTVAAALAPLAVAHDATSSYVGYSLKRGVQVESVAASTTWVADHLTGHPDRYAYRFKAWQIAGGNGAALAWELVALAGFVAVAVAAFRRPLDPWLASFTCVLLFLCGSKVLSPQFMAWGAPLAAVLGGGWFGAYLVGAGLTFLAYSAASGPGAILALSLVRNLVMLGLAGAALWRLLGGRAHSVRSATAG